MIVKYFAHDPGYNIAKEVQEAYLYDSLEKCKEADLDVFSEKERSTFQYVRVTLEIVEK